MKLTINKGIEIKIETRKEHCDIYNTKVENVYVSGRLIATIRRVTDRHSRKWADMRADEKYLVSMSSENAKRFNMHFSLSTQLRTKKEFYNQLQRNIETKLAKMAAEF